MNILAVSLGLIVVSFAETHCSGGARRQPPTLVGRWHVEFTLQDSETRLMQFDAEATGEGTFLPLDRRSNLATPAERTHAQWQQTAANHVSFSGEIEFPIGNVGRMAGRLIFKGAFDSRNAISGRVSFVSNVAGEPQQTGIFTAARRH